MTWLKGKHTFSLGTHNELFKFYNLFIQDIYGSSATGSGVWRASRPVWPRPTRTTSRTIRASRTCLRFAHCTNAGVYAGDQWRLAASFTMTYGVRFDKPQFPDTPHANPLAVADFNMRTDVVPSPKMFSPRVGFAWDLSNGGGLIGRRFVAASVRLPAAPLTSGCRISTATPASTSRRFRPWRQPANNVRSCQTPPRRCR